jgi:hypothetical protein
LQSLAGGGKKEAGAPPSEINDTDGKEKLDERRQKRADRRRQNGRRKGLFRSAHARSDFNSNVELRSLQGRAFG